MKREILPVRLLGTALLLSFLHRGEGHAVGTGVPDERRLPALWKIVSRVELPRAQAEAIARKLGADVEGIENTLIQAGEETFKINVASCRTEDDAAKLQARFVAIHNNDPIYAARRGKLVAEVAGVSIRSIAEKARDILGWGIQETARWKVTFAVAPVTGGPDGGRQPLFDQMLAFRTGGEAGAALRDAASAFTFGSTVTLRHLGGAEEAAAFSFEPTPASRQASGDTATFSFAELPKQAGIPFLRIEGIVPVRAFSPSVPEVPVDIRALTKATKAWPADDPAFSSLAAPLASAPPLVRMEQVLGLTRQKIRSTREGKGTRYGAAEALARGRGHCWDFSDIYITLARAAGLPARQVGGWVADMSGHVWAEVYIDGLGWIAVDPTTTWTGVSVRYVPLWQSENGAGPDFVWWKAPRLERQ